MTKTVDYYFTPASPWSYLGHDRLVGIADRHAVTVVPKPIDLAHVFPVSGGLPLPKRAPQRQAYRLVELARWRDHLRVPINLQPKHGAASADLAARWIIAATTIGPREALDLAGAIFRARWAEERDVSDAATLAELAAAHGLDAAHLGKDAEGAAVVQRYADNTREAIDRHVFGAPTYVYRDELFWGQDRLDFLERALAQ